MLKIAPGVKPSVFSTPTSRTRSRTDIAMVFADTSKMVNITAAETLSRNIFTLPRNETKPKTKACSDSVLVRAGLLTNSSSTACAM